MTVPRLVRHGFVRLAASTLLAGIGVASTAESEPIDIGSRLELFVDTFLIDTMVDTQLRLHTPTARNAALVHDEPWEGNSCCYHTVFADGKICRAYYRASQYDIRTRKFVGPQVTCYAESEDGIHWRKPELGLFEYDGSTCNNIVWMGVGTHNFTPFRDGNPACLPAQRYKALASGRGGLVAFVSPDAIHWTPVSEKACITEGAFDSQNLAFWDSHRGEYRDYHRGFQNGVRDILTCTSDDFVNWTEPIWLDFADIPPEHLYTNAITPYVRAPHLFVGFPKRFVPSRRSPINPHPGISDGVFMSSRNGLAFKRWREAFIRPGPQPERWFSRNNMTAWGLLVTQSPVPGMPEELSLYSTENYASLDSGVKLRRYTLRLDGFVSVNAEADGGEFVTKPFRFEGVDEPRPPAPVSSSPASVNGRNALRGERSLVVKRPAIVPIPGTRELGRQVTFAMSMLGVPAGKRRFLSAYDGGATPGELFFDFSSDGDIKLDEPVAIRFHYDGATITASSADVGDWSTGARAETVHHLAATWDNGDVTLYFDGKKVGSGRAQSGPITLRLGDLRFGEDYPPTTLTNEPFIGTVDDILVLRRVLGSEEIATMAQEGALAVVDTAADTGALYTMEDEPDGVLHDKLSADGAGDAVMPGRLMWGEVQLLMNYSTSAAGSVRCEVQTADGAPVPGFSLEECDEIYGDDISRPVAWRGRTELKELVGRAVRLRFVLKDADIYSIRFR
ncbi:MAG: hypothetical protein HN742_03945 [Lentisphaerae bacterium]|nr:hypothetical protein [Lentisphaerota bacterium]MBT4820726.1 hypothetical protein [Lentisphaerota bacterium]MBT5604883.1 hypothetical protein [Lentisphaerota bacterium]MBT7054198.1 hypothetical protein [Lentisphaerota bacterium]MBT7840995.1 hypothetical protein [Lentisphaerota bacterium]